MSDTVLDVLKDSLIANGPEGLRAALEVLLEKSSKDPHFAAEPHYIKYQIGNQQSYIKVDMSEKPYLFWYCDVQGRPVTKSVQYTIADFLWEKGGEREKWLQHIKSNQGVIHE